MPSRISRSERDRLFGPPAHRYGTGQYGVDPSRLVTISSPWGIRVRVHHLLVEALDEGWRRARAACDWRPVRIDSFAARPVRDSDEPSLHAYGLACDYFDELTPSDVWGPQAAPPAVWTAALESVGFYGGYRFQRRADWPHIEWAAGTPPQSFATPPPNTTASFPEDDVTRHVIQVKTDSGGNGYQPTSIPYADVLAVTGHAPLYPPRDGRYGKIGKAGQHEEDGKLVVFVQDAEPSTFVPVLVTVAG